MPVLSWTIHSEEGGSKFDAVTYLNINIADVCAKNIVLGRHGRRGIERFFMGSSAERVKGHPEMS